MLSDSDNVDKNLSKGIKHGGFSDGTKISLVILFRTFFDANWDIFLRLQAI